MTTQRSTKAIGEYSWTLTSGVVAVKGRAACLDTSTGLLTKGQTSTTLIYVGRFAEGLTGDGTLKCRVELASEAACVWYANAVGPNNVDATFIGAEVYILDDQTVTALSTGASKAGRVLDYDSAANRVLVQVGVAITGPTGAASPGGSVATRTALAAVTAAQRTDGMIISVSADGSKWQFVAASALAADGLSVEGSNIVIVPVAGAGRWIRKDQAFVAKIAIDKTLADAAQLMLVPAGFSVKILDDLSWDITTGFTGGAASAIGISSSDAGSSTKGDLLGGAGGDVTATLGTTGVKQGTAGAKMDTIAHRRALRIEATEYLRFDRITSAYTAGNGFVDVPMALEIVG